MSAPVPVNEYWMVTFSFRPADEIAIEVQITDPLILSSPDTPVPNTTGETVRAIASASSSEMLKVPSYEARAVPDPSHVVCPYSASVHWPDPLQEVLRVALVTVSEASVWQVIATGVAPT